MIKFEKSELLTVKDLTTLLESTEPTERAEIVAPNLKKLIFTFGKSSFKYNNETIAYDVAEELTEGYLSTIISSFITQSKRNLDDKTIRDLEKRYPKSFNALSEMSTINKYSKSALVLLKDDKYKFTNPQFNRVHFRNGYYDLKTGEFKKRERNVDYVNFYIDRDYKQPSQESISKIFKIIDQIYTNKDDRDYLLQAFGIAMTGKSTQQQKILFFIGKGSAGKSTILSMLKLAFEDYVFELDSKTFSKKTSNTDVNKILNTYLINRNIRISNVNEPEDTKMNESLFKDFIDGNIKTTSLYQDGQNLFKHNSKICSTANTMPKIKMDTGVIRRIEAHNHKSKFVSNDSEVNEAKHIYKKDEELLQKLEENEDLLNALSYVIFKYAIDYNNGKIIKQTPSFEEFKEEVIQSNDIIQDFVDKYVIRTEDANDKIGKTEMYNKFKEFQPKSNITMEQLRDDLKNKDFEYLWKPKCNGIQGIFIKCRLNSHGHCDELDEELKSNMIINNAPSDREKFIDEIEKLKAEVARLNKVIDSKTKSDKNAIVITSKPKAQVIDDLDAELAELTKAEEHEKKLNLIIESDDENEDISDLF